jgi:REP element-mobilizing transposase RayT
VVLGTQRRAVVDRTIREVCEYRDWVLHALNVRSNHVHIVVSAACRPEYAMTSFKSWSTRRLREARLIAPGIKIWSRHGSTRYLWSDDALVAACLYTEEDQGEDLALHEPLPDGRGTDQTRHDP